MTLETVAIDSLALDPNNARRHDAKNIDAIERSLNRFGAQWPIAVVGPDNTVIAGNGRIVAARRLGWTEVAIVRSSLSGNEASAFAIADNRTAELASWDDDALRQVLAVLQNDEETDHLATGFADSEIDRLIDGAITKQAEIKIPSIYQVTAQCDDEAQQRRVYEMLEEEGIKCRLSTL